MSSIQPEEIITILRPMFKGHPFFAEMDASRLEEFLEQVAGQAKRISHNEKIVKQGDQDKQFFLVVRGELAAFDETETPRRLLNYLAPGAFFGFRTLLSKTGKRAATVEAVTDSIITVFSEDNWLWLLEAVPGIEDQVKQLEERLDEQSKLDFSGKHPDEITFFIAKRHYLAFIKRLTIPITLLIIPVAILLLAEIFGIGVDRAIVSPIFLPVISSFLVAAVLLTLYHFIDWRNDELILTSKRIIHIERILFYSEERYEAPLTQIQSVTVKSQNLLDVLFDVDDIEVRTAAIGTMSVSNLKAAHGLSRRILAAQNESKRRVAALDKANIRQQINAQRKKTILAETAPPPAEPKVVRRNLLKNPLPKLNYGYFVPRVKESKDAKITWRKHPLVLVKRIFLPLLAVIASFYFLVAGIFGLRPFSEPGHWLIITALLVLFGMCFFWYTHRYDSWRRDVYILTADKIIDVESSAFKLRGEHVREGGFDSIQNITYNIPSWWEQLINLGDVTIKTAGATGDFSFKRVFNPSSIQETIFYRWDRFQEAKRQKNQAAANMQTIEIVHEYHEMPR